jgi:hypothetical protein
MTYPTPPGPRIMYDRDGSVGFYFSNQGVREADPEWLTYLNSDATLEAGIGDLLWRMDPFALNAFQYITPAGYWYAVRFPEPMRIQAVSSSLMFGDDESYTLLNHVVEASADSTNGQDGTWETLLTNSGSVDDDPFGWEGLGTVMSEQALMIRRRHEPSSTANTPWHVSRRAFATRRLSADGGGSRGWRATVGSATRHARWVRVRALSRGDTVSHTTMAEDRDARATMKLHLYGEPDTSASNDRLRFVTTAGDAKSFFDFGELGASDDVVQQFRIENLSDKDALGVVLSVNAANPDVTENPAFAFCRLSIGGGAYSLVVGPLDIAAGTTSDIVSLRVQPDAGRFGPWSPRLTATVEEWS